MPSLLPHCEGIDLVIGIPSPFNLVLDAFRS